jgi:hypothetical protein
MPRSCFDDSKFGFPIFGFLKVSSVDQPLPAHGAVERSSYFFEEYGRLVLGEGFGGLLHEVDSKPRHQQTKWSWTQFIPIEYRATPSYLMESFSKVSSCSRTTGSAAFRFTCFRNSCSPPKATTYFLKESYRIPAKTAFGTIIGVAVLPGLTSCVRKHSD